MRKIEQQMNDAIYASRDWKCGNTQVINIGDVSFVYLYDNHIASVGNDWVEIFDGGYQTATTKSRLNAILKTHAIDGECVFQRNFKWFVHKFIGQAGSSPVFNEYEFNGSFMFA